VTVNVTSKLNVFVVTMVKIERPRSVGDGLGATHVAVTLFEETLGPDKVVEIVDLKVVLLDAVVEV
jgi:hypothetical protein